MLLRKKELLHEVADEVLERKTEEDVGSGEGVVCEGRVDGSDAESLALENSRQRRS